MLINPLLQFTCDSLPPYPCVLQVEKYIRVADIAIQNLNSRCNRYRIKLSGPDLDYFMVSDDKLYILGTTLNFNMPSRNYEVTVSLINSETSQVIVSTSHTVYIDPCLCPVS